MSSLNLKSLFQSSNGCRDKFLSRLFGIFNEDIVRTWCNDPRSPYENVGRPTIKPATVRKGHTLDFALRERQTESIFVSEMKCELEYDQYKYLVLTSPDQLEHHKGAAFQVFLDIARNHHIYPITIDAKTAEVNGAILVWGHCTEEGRARVCKHYGFHTVLSLQDIINDLQAWKNEEYVKFLDQRQEWCKELFENLRAGNDKDR